MNYYIHIYDAYMGGLAFRQKHRCLFRITVKTPISQPLYVYMWYIYIPILFPALFQFRFIQMQLKY